MSHSGATDTIPDTPNSADTAGKSDQQISRVEEVLVTGESALDTDILFCTNSKLYFNRLLPEQYRSKQHLSNLYCGSANSPFTIELRNRGCIHFNPESALQAIVVDIDVLEKISRLWCMVIPNLTGFPELIIPVDCAPDAFLPPLEQIVGSCGHMINYSLHDPPPDYEKEERDGETLQSDTDDETLQSDTDDETLNSDTSDEILDNRPPPPIVSRLENDYLKQTIGIDRVMQYLDIGENETEESPWLPQERNEIKIDFLAEVIRWTNAPHDPHDPEKFRREEMKTNISRLIGKLKWFKSREQKRKKEDKLQQESMRTPRKRREYGREDGNTGTEENTGGEAGRGRKRIQRGVTEV